VKLKKLIAPWPPIAWQRGSLTWDNDLGELKLASFNGPGTHGELTLVASDAQLCRWSTRLKIDEPEHWALLPEALMRALGRSLVEAGEIDLDA
jgi:hypothetical protein